MKDYIDRVCKATAEKGAPILSVPLDQYREGALVWPLGYESDEFCGAWYVQFALAVDRKFMLHTLDLGQARFRFSGADDVQYPDAITENQAKVKRDELIAALDKRFGKERVNTAAGTPEDAMRVCQRLWPTGGEKLA